MKFPLQKLLYPFLIPSGLLFVLAVVFLSQETLPERVLPFLDIYPVAVLGTALLFGYRFNRTRLIYAIVLLLVADRCLDFFSAIESNRFIFLAIAALLPINLVAVSLFRERGMFNLRGTIWLSSIIAQVVGVSWFYAQMNGQAFAWLDHQFIPFPFGLQPSLSQPVLLVSIIALLVLGIRFYFRPAALEGSFLWAFLTILFGLLDTGGQSLTLYFATAGLILVIGVVETSHSMAYRDELTGLPERRALNEALAKLGSKYTVAMLDIDHFKKFNDTHGHDIGDQVLKMVAAKLANVTGGGKCFRYGGEEFSVIFPRTSVEDALPHLELIRETVASAKFIPRGKDRPQKKPNKPTKSAKRTPALSVTISIGAAEKSSDLSTPLQVVKAADQALYRAKNAGRNCVCS